MKKLKIAVQVMLLAFFGCSQDLPTQAGGENASINIDQQVLAKGGNRYTAKARKTRRAPVIDGKKDWLWLGTSRYPLKTWSEFVESRRDLSAYFQIMWDDANLYIFVTVQDEEINTDSREDPWENDSIQLYFDADNSKNTLDDCDAIPYPGAMDSNDDHMTAIFGQSPITHTGHYDVSQFDFAYRQRWGGYTIEAAFPFEALLITPVPGHHFGFDMQIHDNDGGEPQNVVTWGPFVVDGCSYKIPADWGTAILVGMPSHHCD